MGLLGEEHEGVSFSRQYYTSFVMNTVKQWSSWWFSVDNLRGATII